MRLGETKEELNNEVEVVVCVGTLGDRAEDAHRHPTNSHEVLRIFPHFTSGRDDEHASPLARGGASGFVLPTQPRTVQARHRRRRRRRRRRVEWKTTFLHPRAVPHKV
jgi:maltooligosyltrehalose synthase